MANVLTNLAADLYKAADIVSRELVGFIPSVTINADGVERVAKNGTVRSHFTRSVAAKDRGVAMTISEGDDQTVDNKTITISKDRAIEIPWTGEDMMHVNNGAGFQTIYGDQVAQAMRTLVNEAEADLAAAATLGASRAYGTPGTTPFATANDFTDLSFTKKICVDNGGGEFGYSMVVDTTAGATFAGKQAAANLQGDQTLIRQGVLLPHNGTDIRQSAAIQNFTKGAMASATTNAAGYDVGDTVLTLATAGTGVVAAGDIITIAGDTNKYVVAEVSFAGANPASGDTITINAPGLRVAITTSATAITVVNSSARNTLFKRSAIELVVRPPALPVIGGVPKDAAVDRMTIVDPLSGLPFEVAVYLGQGKAMMEVSQAWGVKCWKPEHVAALLG